MKITTITTVLASAATTGAVGIVNAPLASAEDATTSSIGSQAKLVDGNVIQGWTISNIKTESAAATTKGPAAEANSCRYLRVAHDHFTTPMNHLRY